VNKLLGGLVCVGVLAVPVTSFGGTILQPTAATSSLGSFSTQYLPVYAIDQSALSATYVSGVTDFDAFVATTNTVNGGGGLNTWYSSSGVVTGNFDFSLGGPVTIESFALWSDPQITAFQGVKNFNLLADDNAAFSSPTALGSFVALPGLPNAANFGQVFAFSPTSASYVRMEILSNQGSLTITGITEAAFEQQTVVPAPPAVWLLGTAIAGLGGRRWLRRKLAS
jgi:hypothetical protein